MDFDESALWGVIKTKITENWSGIFTHISVFMYRILEHTELEMESNYFESVGFGNGQIDSQKSNLGWIK